MKVFIRSLLLSCLIMPALVLADDIAPRLSTLAAPLAADFSEERNITPVGQYGQTLVRHLQLKAGTQIPSHAAPTRALVIVLNGHGHFDFSGEIIPLHERQVLHMQPGEPHAVIAETNLELLVVRLPEEVAEN